MNRFEKISKTMISVGSSCLVCTFLGGIFMPALADGDFPQKPLTSDQQADRQNLRKKVNVVGHRMLKAPPSDLPGPIVPGAKFLSGTLIQRANGSRTTQLNFSSERDAKEIFEWYERTLRGNGWQVRESETKTGRPEWVIGSRGAEIFFNVHLTESSLKSPKEKSSSRKSCSFTIAVNQPVI